MSSSASDDDDEPACSVYPPSRFLPADFSPLLLVAHQDPLRDDLADCELSVPRAGRRSRGRQLHPSTLIVAFAAGVAAAIACLGSRPLSWLSRRPSQPPHPTPALPASTRGDALFVHPTNGHVYLAPDFATRLWAARIEPSGPPAHPIVSLMANASMAWSDKLTRQSKTLHQAVEEYRRRYGRRPPRGFDRWWSFVSSRTTEGDPVRLPDEYDRIMEVIEPFWALEPAVIRRRAEALQAEANYHTFVVRDGHVTSLGDGGKGDLRAKDQLRLLESFASHLPDVNITMSTDDGPSIFLDWQTKRKHLDYARRGTTIPLSEVDEVNDDPASWGFRLLCPPESRLRRFELGLEVDALPPGPSFIGLDHRKAMDLCENPEWRPLHGFTSWPGPRPTVLKPVFSFSSLGVTSDLLAVPLEQFSDADTNAPDVAMWREKSEARVIWKGRPTGIPFDDTERWRSTHRVRLHALAAAKDGTRRVRIVEPAGREGLVKIVEEEVALAELSRSFLNASMVVEEGGCPTGDVACALVEKEFVLDPIVDWPDQNRYKFVLDVDGNAWSGRFRRLLGSRSVVLKSTIWPEWYRDHIQPWYHYVPAKIDYSDLFDLVSFFSSRDDLAELMAGHAHDFVQHHWRRKDLQAYAWRMYLEWARVSSDDRASMDL